MPGRRRDKHNFIPVVDLYEDFPAEAEAARREACPAKLGEPEGDALKKDGIDFSKAVIIGGPPCQAYSLVGRSRMSKVKASGEYVETEDGHYYIHPLRPQAVPQPHRPRGSEASDLPRRLLLLRPADRAVQAGRERRTAHAGEEACGGRMLRSSCTSRRHEEYATTGIRHLNTLFAKLPNQRQRRLPRVAS